MNPDEAPEARYTVTIELTIDVTTRDGFGAAADKAVNYVKPSAADARAVSVVRRDG